MNEAIEFAKWLQNTDNGTTHYNYFLDTTSESIRFSPFDCFIDEIMSPEELYRRWKELKV